VVIGKSEREEKFRVFCVHLQRDVVLFKDTWEYKILKDHPEVNGRIPLIKDTLERTGSTIAVYKKKRDRDELAIYREGCVEMGYFKYLRIGLKIKSSNLAILATAFGDHSDPPEEMERL
jgi:hypothetical protein